MPLLGLPRMLLVLLLGASGVASAEPIHDRVGSLVACLESRFPDGKRALGSGFFVAPGVMATVGHQVSGARSIKVVLGDGRALSARQLRVLDGGDLALLRVPEDDTRLRPLPAGQARLGDEVFTIGCPLGLGQTMTRGVVSHPDRRFDGVSMIQTDLAINRGNSGGPLVNRSGHLVGVVQGTLRASSGIHFAIPVERLLELMRAAGLHAPAALDERLLATWQAALASTDPAEQQKLYESVLLQAPWHAAAYHNLALVHYGQGRVEQARELFEAALLRRPGFAQALTGLGVALYRLGRHAEAREALLRAISSDPAYALAQFNLGVIYARGVKDAGSAEKSFRRFLELAPDSALAKPTRLWLNQASGR